MLVYNKRLSFQTLYAITSEDGYITSFYTAYQPSDFKKILTREDDEKIIKLYKEPLTPFGFIYNINLHMFNNN